MTAAGRLSGLSGSVSLQARKDALVDSANSAQHSVHAAGCAQPASVRDPVDLVWTGPEVPGIANRDTGVVVRELFANANAYVVVAGYAINQGREIFRALADRMAQIPELKVRMFLNVQRRHRDTTRDSEILREFAQRFKSVEWPGERLPEIFYYPRSLEMEPGKRSSLHAKCIVVDRKTAYVSSANFTEAAQARNIEVGVLVHSEPFARRLVEHFETLAAAEVLLSLPIEVGL